MVSEMENKMTRCQLRDLNIDKIRKNKLVTERNFNDVYFFIGKLKICFAHISFKKRK